MTTRRLIALAAFIAATIYLSANAQQPAAPRQAAPTAAQPAATTSTTAASAPGVNITEARIAIVDTAAFSDEKLGITRLVNAARTVDKEFEPRRTELRTIQATLQKLADDMSKTAPLQEPRVTEQKREQAEKLKREFDFKTQEAQAAYGKRAQEITGPISEDIGRNIDAYAKQRNITLIIDARQVPILYAVSTIDITRDFIAEYNKRNPATAANTAPAPR